MNTFASYSDKISNRLRITYLLLAIVTIVIGLSTRKIPQLFPEFIAEYGGDTLWALLFFLLFKMIWIRKPIWVIAVITYSFCILIECSQLYQGEWIVRLRQTFAGQMLLGQGFLWSDLVAYSVGAGVALFLDKKFSTQNRLSF